MIFELKITNNSFKKFIKYFFFLKIFMVSKNTQFFIIVHYETIWSPNIYGLVIASTGRPNGLSLNKILNNIIN